MGEHHMKSDQNSTAVDRSQRQRNAQLIHAIHRKPTGSDHPRNGVVVPAGSHEVR
jgi:hypothetical protein